MNGSVFVDSNVFLYAVDNEAGDKQRQAAAWLRSLLSTGKGIANLQVMNEVANVLIKRGKMQPESVFSVVDGYASFGSTTIGFETVAAARLIHFRHGYSWWDCLLLAAAVELECRFYLSEDLQHRHDIGGLTIVNPFRLNPPQYPVH